MSNKQPGRPKKPAAEKQTTGINIRMTQAERDRIDKVAGYEPGVWARGVLLKVVDEILRERGDSGG